MGSYKIEQRRVSHRGRQFHFVSYDQVIENLARKEVAMPPTWFLMNSGKRWPVMPQVPGQDPLELDQSFVEWLELNIFARA